MFCARAGASCGLVTSTTNCGNSATVNCGGCTAPQYCGGGGVANVCGGVQVLYPKAATYSRTYTAACPLGKVPVWQTFQWQASVPANTSIVFQAQTAQDTLGSPGIYGPAVPIGTANNANTGTSTPTQWVTDTCSVDQHLRNLSTPVSCPGVSPSQVSQVWLKVDMTLYSNPEQTMSPSLYGWKQTFDCIANE